MGAVEDAEAHLVKAAEFLEAANLSLEVEWATRPHDGAKEIVTA